jgi:hypothetical protein
LKNLQFIFSLILVFFTCIIDRSCTENSPNHETIFVPFGTGAEDLGYIPFDENMEVYGEAEAPLILEGPGAFNVDDNGDLYFLDLAGNAIRKYNKNGELLLSGELPKVDNLEPTYSDLQLTGPNLVFLSDIENNRFVLFNISNGEIIRNIVLPEREIKKSDEDKDGSVSNTENKNTETAEESFFTPYYLEDFRALGQNNILFRDLYDNSIYALKNTPTEKPQIKRVSQSEEIQLNLHQYENGAFAGFSNAAENTEEIIIYALGSEKHKKLFSTGRFVGLGFFELVAIEKDSIAMAFYMGGETGINLRELRVYKTDGTLTGRKGLNIAQLSWPCGKQIRYKNGLLYVLEYEKKANGMKIHLISF